MDRASIFLCDGDEESTFYYDEQAKDLPLPDLDATLERYYDQLKSFGTAEELEHTKYLVEKFRFGIGKVLQNTLKKRTKIHKNWLHQYWEDYAYLSDRSPLLPNCVMAMPVILEALNVPITPDDRIKILARLVYHTLEHWQYTVNEQIKPAGNPKKNIIYTSFLMKRFYSTVRIPGERQDEINSHFKTKREGDTPDYFVVLSKGRIFKVPGVNDDGTILNYAQIYEVLKIIDKETATWEVKNPVPILTCDNRVTWAHNRKHLQELTTKNKQYLEWVEKSLTLICFDDHCPRDWSEICQETVGGDYHSRWADKCSEMISFRNGRLGFIGEHSCYDGTISVSFAVFAMLSFYENPDPCFTLDGKTVPQPVELIFDLDEYLETEINRLQTEATAMGKSIIVSCTAFEHFGKQFMKSMNIYPDGLIQAAIQLAYFKMHERFVPTYETALMRQYYKGRTETVRSCTQEMIDFVYAMTDEKRNNTEKLKAFKKAIDKHLKLMDDARAGNGIDRHLFGLWCAAYDLDLEVPELYTDPLYTRSGGNGNFVLSTSTLGFSINCGSVGPMVTDGYGVFYSITDETIWLIITASRDSETTSAHKFATKMHETLIEIHHLINVNGSAKL